MIGRGLNKDHHVFDLDLDVRQPTMNQRKNKAAEMAKKKAVDAIKRTGGIELDDANKSGRKKKKTVEKIEEIRRRAGDQSAQANSNAPESVGMYMYVCLYVCCMYVCMYVCMLYVCMYVCMYVVCMLYVCMYVCMYVVCMYVCMYVVCMYVVCMYVCIYVVCMYVCMYVCCMYVCM